MSPSIQTEARLILVSAAAGAGLMAVYDCLRIFVFWVRHSWLWVGLEDFLYWILQALPPFSFFTGRMTEACVFA